MKSKLVKIREDQKDFIEDYSSKNTRHNGNAAVRDLLDIAKLAIEKYPELIQLIVMGNENEGKTKQ